MGAIVLIAVALTSLPGWPVYDRFCLPCHGAKGDGKGPAAPYSWGAPRAFTTGVYEWRSTASGQPPTDDDLRTAVRFGVPGTSMHGFGATLSGADVDKLVAVLKAFSPATFKQRGKPIAIGPAPAADPARGAELWKQQGCDKCHGGDGRGVAALVQPPYDLTTQLLRRPRARDDLDGRRKAMALSIATGMAGTPMPGFAGTVADAELWALADHVLALNANAKPRTSAALDDAMIAMDGVTKLVTATWPGNDPDERRIWGAPLAGQGKPPASLAPAQASLSSQQCARCHAKQAREWQTSLHASAATFGLPAREADHALDGAASCNRCHTPLAEQQPADSHDGALRDEAVTYDPALRAEGVTCAACHVRGFTRHGPPRRPESGLLASPGYPLVELAIYERADFCMPCHQLPPRTAVNGKPLLNTYKEWLEGPYMARGIQCQHCHMPNREHQWLGVHDRNTFRQGIKLTAHTLRTDGKVTVIATLANVGAGHYLPTTATPAAWLKIELFDAKGIAIHGARAEQRIGRDVEFVKQWVEKSDTRIPPGESLRMARAWQGGRTAQAAYARITVEVHPDDFYERMYATRLQAKLPDATRKQYEIALQRALASRYLADQQDVTILAP
ncbi:MAG TPA: c-type cytochrome [Kofleriaceae bacterium]